MARKIDYVCDNCGTTYSSIDQIFWIDEILTFHVEPLLMMTSNESSNAPVKGYFTNYFCYHCNKFIDKFIIYEKSHEIEDERIIQIIEGDSDSNKIIQFDDSFQKCLECGDELKSRADYSFVFNEGDEFNIGETILDFSNSENIKFSGEYHGYFCDDCKKQINKFIITENSTDLSDNEIKSILSEHTNDLTIFIRRDFDLCPECGEKVHYLHNGSTCPNCREGRFIAESETMMD